MEVIHISAECYPAAKVGGLGDVIGALPKYQNELGYKASVVMPLYENKFKQEGFFETIFNGTVEMDKCKFPFSVIKETTGKQGFDLFLVSIPGMFDRPEVYGYQDDSERFLAFQIAVLDWLLQAETYPEVIHCHDHHAGLIAFLITQAYKYQKLKDIPTIITIHNALYQGQFGFDKIMYLPDFNLNEIGLLEWNHCINPLATAIKCSWMLTTVSPSYLEEIQHFSNGLESLLESVQYKSTGILNGIDTDYWNPMTDNMILHQYNHSTVLKGKQNNKKSLCQEYNFDANLPLFAFIGRLEVEKGCDLLAEVINNSFLNHPNGFNFLALGAGNKEIETELEALIDTFPKNYNVHIGYNEVMSHKVYAGADFLVMPSRSEPCGLTQLYALRYGTIPIVTKTGGLKDTIIDITEGGLGISHNNTTTREVCQSINRAMTIYQDKALIENLRVSGMLVDYSWETQGVSYIKAYESLV